MSDSDQAPTTTLVLVVHADPGATPPYYASIFEEFNVEICFLVSHFGAFSSAYVQLAEHLGAPLLPAIAKYAGASYGLEAYARVLLVSWSAGYALVRAVLAEPSAGHVEPVGWVALDSGYGPPSDGILELAREAREGSRLFYAGHTDIPTQGYLSSGESLRMVVEAVGEPEGRFRVESWGGTDAAAHVAALHVHGPALVRAALLELGVGGAASATTDPAPSNIVSHEQAMFEGTGTRQGALAVALAELGNGEAAPGSHAGPDVAKYFAGCERGGRPVGVASGNWCAAFVGWCDSEAATGAPWRASVAELWADGPVVYPLGVGYNPRPGDLAIFRRDGEDPRTGGHGHVGRVVNFDGPALRFETVEGNHGGRVARVTHEVTDPALVGWVGR